MLSYPTPAGSIVAHPKVAGRHWALWATGTKGNDNNTYSFVAASNFTHGTVDTLKGQNEPGRRLASRVSHFLTAAQGAPP